MKAYVESRGGTVPAGLILEVPQAISTDGRYIVGHGVGNAWRITISSDCDFDTNGVCDIVDLDDLVTEIAATSHDPLFDLTGDGLVDLADRDAWLIQAGAENLPSGNAYLVGDADLNGNVDGSDFNLWNAHKFDHTAKWSQGDFNADGNTDGSDFGLWNAHKFSSSLAITAVPEPAGRDDGHRLGRVTFLGLATDVVWELSSPAAGQRPGNLPSPAHRAGNPGPHEKLRGLGTSADPLPRVAQHEARVTYVPGRPNAHK